MFRSVVTAFALLPLAVPAPAAAAGCPVGLWRLTGYQQKAVSKVYDTDLTSKGVGGTTVKVAADGTFTYDFKKAVKLVTKGHNNGVRIAETALYRRVLKHKAVWRGGKVAVKRSTATGTALVKTVQTQPERATRLEKVAGLVRIDQATIVPTGRVVYTCTATTLHLKRTIKLDSRGGREVTHWWFQR